MMEFKLAMESWQFSDALQLVIQNYRGPFPEEKIERKTYFRKHPFGLSVPVSKEMGKRSIVVLENPGVTETSVHAMASVVAAQLRFAGRKSLQIFYLRVIECAAGPRYEGGELLDLYFEFGGLSSVLIVGGVNDYSGTGGDGGDSLERIFAFASAMFGLPVERTRIPLPSSRAYQERLLAEYDAQRRRS